MANSATLSGMRDRVSANIDRTISTTTFVTETLCDQWLNDGLSKIHYLLADSGEDYLSSSGTVALASGTDTYSLSSDLSITDLYKIKGVDLVQGSHTYDVPRYMVGERNAYGEAAASPSLGSDSGYMYRLKGLDIVLIPPPGSGTLRVNYVPQFTKIGAGDNVHSSVPEGWEDYAVLMASARAMQRERGDASMFLTQANEMWAMMNRFFEPRDQAEPLRIVDSSKRWERAHHWWPR